MINYEQLSCGWGLAKEVTHIAKKLPLPEKDKRCPESYDDCVYFIFWWLSRWLRFSVPPLEDILYWLARAFWYHQRDLRRPIDECYYEEFADKLRNDVLQKYEIWLKGK